MYELKKCIRNLTDNLKNTEDHYFGEKTSADERASKKWRQKLCMLDGGYKPTLRERFQWFTEANYSLESAAIALNALSSENLSKENTPEARKLWNNVFDAAHACSGILLKSLTHG